MQPATFQTILFGTTLLFLCK